MSVLAWIFFWLLGWPLLGCVALGAVDTKDAELLRWLDECPVPTLRLVVLYFWPVLFVAWITRRWWQV